MHSSDSCVGSSRDGIAGNGYEISIDGYCSGRNDASRTDIQIGSLAEKESTAVDIELGYDVDKGGRGCWFEEAKDSRPS